MSKTAEDTIAPELNYTYGVSDLFDFEANLGYQSHGTYSIWSLTAGIRSNLAYYDKLVPFLAVDFGFFDHAEKILFGLQAGLGLDLILTPEIYFGARFNMNTMFKKELYGGSYGSFMIHAGYSFD